MSLAGSGLWPYGWSADLERAFEAVATPGLVPGRVVLEHNHVYRIVTETGELLAELAGRLKHRAAARRDLPAVGDWVAVRPDPRGGRALVQHVLPRRSRFSRQAAGRETGEQIVAANIDVVFLVFGLDKPVNRRSIERYLLVARRGGADPIVVLNKADACADPDAAVAEARLAAGDAPVHAVSARTGRGFEALEIRLGDGRTAALLGPSGAGKSSIVNRLIGRDLLATGAVRDWDRRGRHTSVHRQLLLRQQGGLVIDTPGMRELQLWDSEDDVDESFADIAGLAGGCRFRDCRHETEPGCAVKLAVEEGRLDAGRHESFLKLQAEQQAAEARREERALLESRRKGRPQR